MNNPYRKLHKTIEVPKGKKRSWVKTLTYKFLIKCYGKFNERFYRCKNCQKALPMCTGSGYDPSPFFHYLRCELNYGKRK